MGCETGRQRLRPRGQVAADDRITQERQVLGAGLMRGEVRVGLLPRELGKEAPSGGFRVLVSRGRQGSGH